jgi:hypothetical protein
MSKVTPSALRGLSVAAGTVGLAAVGAAVMAGQASAAGLGAASLAGGGLPVSTNAVPAVLGAVAHNQGTVAGMPLSNLPVIGQLPGMTDDAAPASDALPGLGYADLGELPVTRSRPVPGSESARAPYVARHASPVSGVPAPATPVAPVAPAAPYFPSANAPAPSGPQIPNAETGPMDTVNNALHQLPIAGQLTGPGGGLPVVGGLAGGLPLGGLTGGLTGGLSSLGG